MIKKIIRRIINYFKMLYYLKINKDCVNVIHYINNGTVLPKALSDDEEKELLDDMENNKDEVKQKLIEHNLRLVIYIAKKFENSEVDLEDLISIGSIGLIKAINSFDKDKNIKIATFASKCIANEILMHLRKISKSKNEVSLDEPINIDTEGNELLITDLVGEDENPQSEVEKQTEKNALWCILNRLNEREKEIMTLRYGLNGCEEKTQKEVADDLGISQSYISRLEKRILSRMKKEMQKLA